MKNTEELTLTEEIVEEKSEPCCGPECCQKDTQGSGSEKKSEKKSEKSSEDLKQIVKEQYSKIALQSKEVNSSSCCGANPPQADCDSDVYSIMTDEYKGMEGYNPDADLGLGCGLPTQFAKIKEGYVVLDLGSGAGNDCFIARAQTGEKGRVIGIDMTPAMIEKAQKNTKKLGYNNIDFYLGDIEDMPIADNTADVVVSNCVLNLVPDKVKAFSEIYRVTKPGGHFSISDIVLTGELPERIKQAAEMYAGCVSGAVLKDKYVDIIERSGFKNIAIQKEKLITVPDSILNDYLTGEEITEYRRSGYGIYSITVYGEKA